MITDRMHSGCSSSRLRPRSTNVTFEARGWGRLQAMHVIDARLRVLGSQHKPRRHDTGNVEITEAKYMLYQLTGSEGCCHKIDDDYLF